MATLINTLSRRMGMHHDNATYVLHWGYGSRAMPCMNDPASCLYLDSVYIAHDKGMLYAGVMWIIILVVLGAMGVYYRVTSAKASIGDTVVASSPFSSGLSRACRAIGATSRRYLLPDSIRFIFGRTTRFQVVILTILTIYLTIFSFVGLLYGKWMSPVKNRPGEPEGLYDTRTTLGPWSNRIGIFAYALTPLSVLLSSRESLLSVLTGVPYQHFMFLHRWVGYIIVIQSVLHTIAWTVIMAKLYGPQPRRGNEWIASLYMIWGTVAIILLLLLYVFSLPFVIRRTGYEFFRKSHYVLAMVYCGACIAHWELLHCFLTPAIALWFMDRFMRLGRTYLIHREAIGKNSGFFHPAQAAATLFPNSVEGDMVRLDFQQPSPAWHIGQHYYLCFTDGSIWQSHPFTPLNAPVCVDGVTTHSYIFRAKSGETRKIAEILKSKAQDGGVPTTPVILTGPYGEKLLESHRPDENILCVAGGTGVTYVLPIIMATIRDGIASNRKLELIWFVRHASDVEWIRPEIDALETLANGVIDLTIRVFATRDNETEAVSTSESSSDEREKNEVTAVSNSASSSDEKDKDEVTKEAKSKAHKGRLVSVQLASSITTAANSRHPDVRPLVEDFLDKTIAGPTTVIASGPGAMMSELRRVIADNNSGSKVWKGQQRYDVSLQCDDRLEY